MLTLDVLICSIDKGIVRVADSLNAPQEGVRYIVSYQYTDERYLELIPDVLRSRSDVSLATYNTRGLSANRNLALGRATADIIIFADDDTRATPEAYQTIARIFEDNPDLDIAFFSASTYTGKPLKNYPDTEQELTEMPESYTISAIEMACRRTSVQGSIRFDERFGLGTPFLTCGEDEIWMADASRLKLRMRYYPIKIVETSTLLKKSMLYVDGGVQRSLGAIMYYKYGASAWWKSFRMAAKAAREGYCHFLPMFRHLAEGIRYMKRTE